MRMSLIIAIDIGLFNLISNNNNTGEIKERIDSMMVCWYDVWVEGV